MMHRIVASGLLRQIVKGLPCITIVLGLCIEIGMLPNIVQVFPFITLCSLYYWVIYRPDLVPLSFLILIGLFYDVMLGTPFGFHSLFYVSIYWLLLSQRRHFVDQPFLLVWAGFVTLAVISQFLRWAALILIMGQYFPFLPILFHL